MENNDDDFLKTLCGNHDVYRDILKWLRAFEYKDKLNEKSCIFISGDPCIGKTYSIQKICCYLQFYIINIDSNNCYNSQQFKDIIFKSLTSSLIHELTNISNKKVIIIDNFDSMFVADKTINLTLLKILTEGKYKNAPIICITSQDILKKMGNIKKLCCTFELKIPTNAEIENILKQSNINTKHIKQICQLSNGNLDKVFKDVQNIHIYENNIDEKCSILQLYNNTFIREKVRRILETDIWLIPLRFHENLIMELCNRNMSYVKKKTFYKLFIDTFCIYDYYMCSNNNDIAVEIFTSLVHFLSVLKYKKKQVSNMDNFTKILSYLSLQKKNIKYSYNSNFPLYQIRNYHINLLNRKFIYFN